MNQWESKFADSSPRSMGGARLVADYAQALGLQRTDKKQKSVMWGTGATNVFWCFPDDARSSGGSRSGLELFMRNVPEDVARSLRSKLVEFGAPQRSDPSIAWGIVVNRWVELRDEVLAPYAAALSG